MSDVLSQDPDGSTMTGWVALPGSAEALPIRWTQTNVADEGPTKWKRKREYNSIPRLWNAKDTVCVDHPKDSVSDRGIVT